MPIADYNEPSTPCFKATQNKGTQMTFASGWTISIQWGPGNYCENHSLALGDEYDAPMTRGRNGPWVSKDAEIALWHGDRTDWYYFGGDTVKGYLTTDEVAKWIYMAASGTLPPEPANPNYDDEED